MEERSQYLLRRKCWRKRSYSTAKAARAEGKKITKRTNIKLYQYRCSHCREYHLTKQISAKGQIL